MSEDPMAISEEMIEQFGQIRRVERRYLIIEPIVIACLCALAAAIAWAHGALLVTSLTSFFFGSAVGSLIVGRIYRRGAYRRMKVAVEQLGMYVAYHKEAE